jgi:hypothetical protein
VQSELHLLHAGGLPLLRRARAPAPQNLVPAALTRHSYRLPRFVAEAALGRSGGAYVTIGASARTTTIHAAQEDGQLPPPPLPGMNPHFCPAVCWCCDQYTTFDCCYACGVCYIAKSL